MNLTLKLHDGRLRVRISDDQHWLTEPRVGKGQSGGGEWTSGGGGAASPSWQGSKTFTGSGEGAPPARPSEPAATPPPAYEREALGHGYSKQAYLANGVVHTSNVYDAARALYENRKVELDQPREVATLIKHLGEVAARMIRLGEKAPVFDLCNVAVEHTNLFCAQSKGIPRVKMPQLSNEQTQAFIAALAKQGYKVEQTEEETDHLRATQNEQNGAKVAAIAAHYDPKMGGRTVVSRDNYILDGHHRWAAQIGLDAIDNKFTEKTKITRVDISITDLLRKADEFTGGAGHEGVEVPLGPPPERRVYEQHGPAPTPPPGKPVPRKLPPPALKPKEVKALSAKLNSRLAGYQMRVDGGVNIAPAFHDRLISDLEKLGQECPLDGEMRLTTQWPLDMDLSERDDVAKTAYASMQSNVFRGQHLHNLWINPYLYSDEAEATQSMEQDRVSEFHDGIGDPIACITHEYGHALEASIMQVVDPNLKFATRDLGPTDLKEALGRIADLYDVAHMAARAGVGSVARALTPTGYALSSPREWWAECFAVARHGNAEFKNREAVRLEEDIVKAVAPVLTAIRDGKAKPHDWTPEEKTKIDAWEKQHQAKRQQALLGILESIADQVSEDDKPKFEKLMKVASLAPDLT